MRVSVWGEGFLADVTRRNLPAFGHEVVTVHGQIGWIADDDAKEAVKLAHLHFPCVVSTALPFALVERLPEAAAYVPENIRRSAPDVTFQSQTAGIVGRLTSTYDAILGELLSPIYPMLIWAQPLTAALYKHMLGSYLAMCLTLTNEWAQIGSRLNVDAEDAAQAWPAFVQDIRVSMAAPWKPGPFDGSHLWREVRDFPKGLPLLDALAKCDSGVNETRTPEPM